jgi:hypothetical protein
MPFPVLITYANSGYYDFSKNLLKNLNETIKNHKICFFCLDENIFKKINNDKIYFSNLNLEIISFYQSNILSSLQDYGTKEYNKITQTKILILREALKKFSFIHFIDCDVVCFKEPNEEFYTNYENFDIVFQYDCGCYDKYNLHHPPFYIWTCTGNMTLRDNERTHFLLNEIEKYQMKNENMNDQECLYQYFKDLNINNIRDFNRTNYIVMIQKNLQMVFGY